MHGVPCGMRGARVHVLIHGVPSVSGARVVRMWDAWCAGACPYSWCAMWDAWCTGACPYSWCAERLRCAGSAGVGCAVCRSCGEHGCGMCCVPSVRVARVCGARVHVLIHGVPSVSGTRVARVWDVLCAERAGSTGVGCAVCRACGEHGCGMC